MGGKNDNKASGTLVEQTEEDPHFHHIQADKLLEQFGNYGKYQVRTIVLLCVINCLYSIQTLIMGFVGNVPDFICERIEDSMESSRNLSVVNECILMDQQGQTFSCLDVNSTRIRFYEEVYTTLSSEFSLACKKHLVKLAFSLFMIGGMIFTPIITQISDLYGRRSVFLSTLWIAVMASIACSISPNIFVFLFFRFVLGSSLMSCACVGWVLACESASLKLRDMIPLINTWTWLLGSLAVGLARIYVEDWRVLYLLLSLPFLLTFFYFWLIPESLHWLTVHNKQNDILRYIRTVSKFNKVEVSLNKCKENRSSEDKEKSQTFLDLIRNKAIIFHLMAQCFILIVMNVSYWGLALASTNLSTDKYTGYFVSALTDLPASFLCIPLLHHLGRRTITFWALISQAVFMGLSTLFPGKSILEISLPILARFFNAIIWWSHPLLLAEMSPTSIRNLFYGIAMFFGEVGSVVAPYLELLADIDERLPQLAIATLSLLAGLVILTAPETKGKQLPEDIEQFDAGSLWKRTRKSNQLQENLLKSDIIQTC